MRLTTILLIGIAFSSQVIHENATGAQGSEEKYLCAVDSASGVYYYDSLNRWGPSTFRVEEKFIIAPYVPSAFDSADFDLVFQITELGSSVATGWCKEGFNKRGILSCGMPAGEFRFNRNNRRFLLSYTVGYYDVPSGSVNTSEENANTP